VGRSYVSATAPWLDRLVSFVDDLDIVNYEWLLALISMS
jgi:hypothetical protein